MMTRGAIEEWLDVAGLALLLLLLAISIVLPACAAPSSRPAHLPEPESEKATLAITTTQETGTAEQNLTRAATPKPVATLGPAPTPTLILIPTPAPTAAVLQSTSVFAVFADNWQRIVGGCLLLLLLIVGLTLVVRALRRKKRTSPAAPTPPPPVPTGAYLESVGTPGGPRCSDLKAEGVTIGRAPENDLVITQDFPGWETVSRRHAHVQHQMDRWIVEDLDSMNGIYVNGRRTGRNLLRAGWQLGIGGVEFVFRTNGGGTTIKCPSCGYENREDARSCRDCGAVLTMALEKESGERTRESATRPLSGASIGFTPLPEGALLHDGRYVVAEGHATDERSNVYLVQDTRPVRLCPNCQTETADPQERFCSFCKADLSGTEPLHLHYLMHESAGERAFAVEAQLLGMCLEHRGLLLPRDVFTEAPYGPSRHYQLEPEFSPPLATSPTVPQRLNRVLEWGISLAQALDYLHCHQVTLREVSLNHIAVEGKKAYWAHLGTAYAIPPEARSETTRFFAQDIQGLAAVLFYLATGQQEASQIQLPEQATMTFSQALTAPTTLTAADFATALETTLEALRRPASTTLVVGHRTDVGQERSLNEDSLLTLDIVPVYRSVSAPVGLFVVADGMGGHEAGDVASRMAIQTIARHAVGEVLTAAAAGERPPDARQWLTATMLAANQAVYDQRRAAGTDMGTTLVMALVVGDTATIVNVGDSRAYLLKQDEDDPDHRIVQITTDHSLVQRLVATGQITLEEAIHHPQRNIIYRVIGDTPQAAADLFEQRLAPGQAVLLCSDGLSGIVPNEQIWHIWQTSTSPQEACDQLVEAANQAGGGDNITVVIVQVVR